MKYAFVGYSSQNYDQRTSGIDSNAGETQSLSRCSMFPNVKPFKFKITEGNIREISNDLEMNAQVPLNFFFSHSKEHDWVADFFCGSGSASVAALLVNRNVVAVDINTDQVLF